jgi:hypothetical protein
LSEEDFLIVLHRKINKKDFRIFCNAIIEVKNIIDKIYKKIRNFELYSLYHNCIDYFIDQNRESQSAFYQVRDADVAMSQDLDAFLKKYMKDYFKIIYSSGKDDGQRYITLLLTQKNIVRFSAEYDAALDQRSEAYKKAAERCLEEKCRNLIALWKLQNPQFQDYPDLPNLGVPLNLITMRKNFAIMFREHNSTSFWGNFMQEIVAGPGAPLTNAMSRSIRQEADLRDNALQLNIVCDANGLPADLYIDDSVLRRSIGANIFPVQKSEVSEAVVERKLNH